MQLQAVVSPVPQGWKDLNCRFLFSFSGSLCFFFCPFSIPLTMRSKFLSDLTWSVWVPPVPHTLAMCHTTLRTCKPLASDGWGQTGAAGPVHTPISAHPLSLGNGLHDLGSSPLAVLVVTYSPAAAENKQRLFIIRHPCNRSSHYFVSQRIHSIVEGVFGGSFFREYTPVKGQSNTKEAAFQEEIIHLKAGDTQVFSLFCCRLPAGP